MEKLKLILLGSLLVATTQAAPVNLTITDDAYLEDGVRKNNAYLKVETDVSRTRISYLKVDLSMLMDPVTNALLKMTTTAAANEPGGNGTIQIYEGSDTDWTEDTLSSDNAPIEGALLTSVSGTFSPNQQVEFDLTTFMAATSKTTLSLVIKMAEGGNDIWLGSTEGAGSPLLVINDEGQPEARPEFDKSKDLLVAQFDSKPDADDIHAQAALGCMLAHPDLAGINYFAVAGAIGTQSGTFIHSEGLFTLAFGTENTYWTDANGDWSGSVTRIKAKGRAVLDAGGKVWVQEAGQSNITADWIAALISDGVAEALIKENVIVVQHSAWNEGKTASADLAYVQDKATYIAIDDGNADPGDYSRRAYRGPETPNYTSSATSWLIDAKSESNTNAHTRALWTEADRIIDESGFSEAHSDISVGGVDYSDCCENWWIFNVGSDAGSVTDFWNRYVVTGTAEVNPPSGDTVYLEENGLVVMELENTPSDLDLWIKKTDVLTTPPTGTGYLEFTGNNTSSGPADSPLEYTFKVNQSGYYYLHLRCARETIGDRTDVANDCYIRVEGNYGAGPNVGDSHGNDAPLDELKTNNKYYGGGHLKFVWATGARLDLGGETNKRQPVYNFYAGETYTLVVSGRSQLFKLDRIVFRHESTAVSTAQNTALGESEILNPAPRYTYAALDDFDISSVASGDVPYYKDNARGALAIDATELTYRDKFAQAILAETVPAGTYDVSITAMRELDGECTYQLYVNGMLVGSKVNSITTVDYALQEHTFSGVVIPESAEIIVKSNDVSNEQVPENGGWAYARGRWTTLSFASANQDGNPTVRFNTPSEDTYVYVGADLSVIVDASDSDDIAWVDLYKDDVLIRKEKVVPYQWNDVGQATDAALQDVEEGSFILTAVASDSLGNESSASITVTVLVDPPVQQAEDYSAMYGIQTEACTDVGGGQNIGYIENSDWAEYSINLPSAGCYTVDFRAATDKAGGTIQMKVGDSEIGSALVANTGDWQAWVTVSTTATFDTAGPQTLRLNFIGGSGYLYNLNWFEMTKVDAPSGYDAWASTNGITGEPADDDDGDGLNNFFEYAISEKPKFSLGEDSFEYVYKQRTDDPALIYTVETCTNLASGVWTTVGYTVMETNVAGIYNDVTIRILADRPQLYIRLKIKN